MNTATETTTKRTRKTAGGAAKPKATKKATTPKGKPRAARPSNPGTHLTSVPTGKGIEALLAAQKRYQHDKEHKTAGGHVSVNNGDELAVKLMGKDLDAVYAAAAKALKVDESELRTKYGHLNAGMQRMNLGNRMRAAAK